MFQTFISNTRAYSCSNFRHFYFRRYSGESKRRCQTTGTYNKPPHIIKDPGSSITLPRVNAQGGSSIMNVIFSCRDAYVGSNMVKL